MTLIRNRRFAYFLSVFVGFPLIMGPAVIVAEYFDLPFAIPLGVFLAYGIWLIIEGNEATFFRCPLGK